MVRPDQKNEEEISPAVFNYSYVVLAILLLLTVGATLAYYQNSSVFESGPGSRWTPVVFLIGLCVSLVIFGLTHRDSAARYRLHQRTLDLIEAQKQNQALLDAEQNLRIVAEQANHAKDEFLAIVSHELKTPLNAIAGWNRILKTPGISNEMRNNAIQKIDRNLQFQISIVEELLNFSDIMSTGSESIRRSVPMLTVYENAIAAVSVAAFQKGVTLVSEDRLNGTNVLGDSERLKMALVNVLMNAVKFTPSGGSVEARAFESDGYVKCVVADTGLGISPDFLPHVFERYRQSEDATTRQFGGLGLGLTIADQIIKLHGGTIVAESAGVGSGSTFTIAIPKA